MIALSVMLSFIFSIILRLDVYEKKTAYNIILKVSLLLSGFSALCNIILKVSLLLSGFSALCNIILKVSLL